MSYSKLLWCLVGVLVVIAPMAVSAGEDVTLHDLRCAFKAATGRELRINTIES